MKTTISTILLILMFIVPPGLLAKGPGASPSNAGVSQGGLATLDQLLRLNDAELEQLEATIRRIRQMSPEERAQYQEQITRFQQMPPAERQSMQRAWGKLDARVRTAWRSYMMGRSVEEREAVRKALHETPPEERTRWRIEILEKEGLLPEDMELTP